MSDQTPLEPRVQGLEQIVQILTTLFVRADERMDRHESWVDSLGTRMEQFGERMEQLGERMEQFGERIEQVGTRVEELAEAQKQTEANLSALTNIVVDLGRAQTRTEQSLTKLSEAQAHTEQRLDALVDIIQGRGE